MSGGGQHTPEKKTVLVFYVGGVTMAEVAALRFLSQVSQFSAKKKQEDINPDSCNNTKPLQREESTVDYVVATTSVITGNTFLQALYHKLEAPIF